MQGFSCDCIHKDSSSLIYPNPVQAPIVPCNPLITPEEDEFFHHASYVFESLGMIDLINALHRVHTAVPFMSNDASLLFQAGYLTPMTQYDTQGAKYPLLWDTHLSLYKHQFPSSTISLSPCSIREAIYLAKHLILLLLHLYPLYTILCLHLICHPVLDCHVLYYNILYPLVLILPQLFVTLVPLPIFALIISLLYHLSPISVVIFAMCVLPFLLLLVITVVITIYDHSLWGGGILF
jgi:hypothetical protein